MFSRNIYVLEDVNSFVTYDALSSFPVRVVFMIREIVMVLFTIRFRLCNFTNFLCSYDKQLRQPEALKPSLLCEWLIPAMSMEINEQVKI